MQAIRLDKYLVINGHVDSREKAQQLIQQKAVAVNGQVKDKPATPVSENDRVTILENKLKFVSRGGYKLEKALLTTNFSMEGKSVIDIGASTGGFTDCALQFGAAHVTAVDIGSGQLDQKLANHSQVTSYENCDIRKITPNDIHGPFDVLVADLSFISLEKVLEHLTSFVNIGGDLLVLVKPQFEQSTRKSFKGGIIKDDKVRQAAFKKIVDFGESIGLHYLFKHETVVAENEQKNIEAIIHFKKK
ncbi:MAG: TlyA family RNA methyltransferase [Bacteroidota bacterium]